MHVDDLIRGSSGVHRLGGRGVGPVKSKSFPVTGQCMRVSESAPRGSWRMERTGERVGHPLEFLRKQKKKPNIPERERDG